MPQRLEALAVVAEGLFAQLSGQEAVRLARTCGHLSEAVRNVVAAYHLRLLRAVAIFSRLGVLPSASPAPAAMAGLACGAARRPGAD